MYLENQKNIDNYRLAFVKSAVESPMPDSVVADRVPWIVDVGGCTPYGLDEFIQLPQNQNQNQDQEEKKKKTMMTCRRYASSNELSIIEREINRQYDNIGFEYFEQINNVFTTDAYPFTDKGGSRFFRNTAKHYLDNNPKGRVVIHSLKCGGLTEWIDIKTGKITVLKPHESEEEFDQLRHVLSNYPTKFWPCAVFFPAFMTDMRLKGGTNLTPLLLNCTRLIIPWTQVTSTAIALIL